MSAVILKFNMLFRVICLAFNGRYSLDSEEIKQIKKEAFFYDDLNLRNVNDKDNLKNDIMNVASDFSRAFKEYQVTHSANVETAP